MGVNVIEPGTSGVARCRSVGFVLVVVAEKGAWVGRLANAKAQEGSALQEAGEEGQPKPVVSAASSLAWF